MDSESIGQDSFAKLVKATISKQVDATTGNSSRPKRGTPKSETSRKSVGQKSTESGSQKSLGDKSKPTKSYINPEQFDMRIAAIRSSVVDCDGGKCVTHIREAMNDIQKARDKADRDYMAGKIDVDTWKKTKRDITKVQKNVDSVLNDNVSHFEKCMVGKSKKH